MEKKKQLICPNMRNWGNQKEEYEELWVSASNRQNDIISNVDVCCLQVANNLSHRIKRNYNISLLKSLITFLSKKKSPITYSIFFLTRSYSIFKIINIDFYNKYLLFY
jgi:hypothetical protein